LPVTNTLAYLASSSATKEKSFITLSPGLHSFGFGFDEVKGKERERGKEFSKNSTFFKLTLAPKKLSSEPLF
jgi:hypothetical protein